ncbi:hypothetical protein BC831DRAFT_463705 [Entophlyctis helioformis]|nr:hypothetical protein BC831DRAFT_463705 [Entophlyctis helioformis]
MPKDASKNDAKAAGASGAAGGGGEFDIDSEEGGPVSSFQSYAAEGDILAKQGDYRKAIEAYSKALTLRPMEKNALVARSKCYLQLGDSQAALLDADAALKEDRDFFKGVFQKAEALYSKGDFEMALVYYHRGNKLRPELDEFRLGIQKAREAIDNSIGNPKDYKFQPPPGARLVVTVPTGSAGAGGHGHAKNAGIATGVWVSTKTTSGPGFSSAGSKEGTKTEKTVKQLLGELYADKEYLEEFLNDKGMACALGTQPQRGGAGTSRRALKYLDTRTEFWRQQKPIYARKKEQSKVLAKAINTRNRQVILAKAEEFQRRQAALMEREQQAKVTGGFRARTAPAAEREHGHLGATTPALPASKTPSPPKSAPTSTLRSPPNSQSMKTVESSFQYIRLSMSRGEYEIALRRSKNLLARLSELRNLPDKGRIAVDLYNILGSIYIQLGNSTEALNYYRKELAAAKENRVPESVSRSLGEMGRIYVKTRRYKDAIAAFDEKLSYAPENSIERAWLYHDLGRCFLEIKQFERAAEFGEHSILLADALKDRRWGLNARVLVAQALSQLDAFDRAMEYYAIALRHAKDLGDEPASHAISKVLDDMRRHFAALREEELDDQRSHMDAASHHESSMSDRHHQQIAV